MRTLLAGFFLLATLPAAAQSFLVGVRAGAVQVLQGSEAWETIYENPATPALGLKLALFPDGRWSVVASVDALSVEGEQVVFLPEPVPTGVTAKLDLRLGHLTLLRALHRGIWGWNAGVGISAMQAEESSEFESASATEIGGHVAMGLHRDFGRLRTGVDVMYFLIPNAFGEAGTSGQTQESEFGGVSVAAAIGWKF